MAPFETSGLSRRELLVGGLAAGAGALALAACSSGGSGTDTLELRSGAPGPSLAAIFPSSGGEVAYLYPGAPQRMPFALIDQDGAFLATGPRSITFTVTDDADETVGEPVTVALHDEGLEKGYYPLEFTFPSTGIYSISGKVGSDTLTQAVKVGEKSTTVMIAPGQKAPAVATPTVADHRGVEPICTATPACPLHEVSLADVVGTGRPVAFLIATPAYCQTAICGPVLDVLTAARAAFADRIAFVHAEVYQSGEEASENIATAAHTAAVKDYQLLFEPSLTLIKGDGTVMGRLDTIYDADELHTALTRLAA